VSVLITFFHNTALGYMKSKPRSHTIDDQKFVITASSIQRTEPLISLEIIMRAEWHGLGGGDCAPFSFWI